MIIANLQAPYTDNDFITLTCRILTEHDSYICNGHYSYVDMCRYLNMMDTFMTIDTPIYMNVTTCILISVHVCRDL